MDYKRLKSLVEKIELSEEMRARIIKNCESHALYETEESTMPKSKTGRRFKGPAMAAAVLFLCLCSTGVAAAGRLGFFRNITDWKGAIVGTKYEQASDEIKAEVFVEENEITVRAVVVDPTVVPYSEIETFGIENYKIIDSSGKVILKGERTEMSDLIDGVSEITIPLDHIGSGEYKLVITAFVGASKGDQPLQIDGTWECDFSL